jgi:adenylosuccinate synthase
VAAQARLRVRHDDGSPRRVGWYDAPITRYATRINGITDLVLTKLDILTGLEQIPVCVAYDVDGERFDEVPVNQSDFHHATRSRVLPGLAGRHLRRAELRGPARPGAGVRARSGGDERHAHLGDRRGPARDAVIVRHDLVD